MKMIFPKEPPLQASSSPIPSIRIPPVHLQSRNAAILNVLNAFSRVRRQYRKNLSPWKFSYYGNLGKDIGSVERPADTNSILSLILLSVRNYQIKSHLK